MLLGAIFSAVTTEARADVYKFVDSTGHVFYTDNPRHAGYKRIIRTPVTLRRKSMESDTSGRSPLYRSSRSIRGLGFENHKLAYAPLIEAAASKFRLDPALLHAVIRVESAYNPSAVSNKGAVGLMQLMPGTAARYGVRNRHDPVENIEGGARYLSELIDMFPSDLRLAIAAYNAGENAVKRHGNKVPPIPETRDYVVRVLDYYNRTN